jgi:hypothetical protein
MFTEKLRLAHASIRHRVSVWVMQLGKLFSRFEEQDAARRKDGTESKAEAWKTSFASRKKGRNFVHLAPAKVKSQFDWRIPAT